MKSVERSAAVLRAGGRHRRQPGHAGLRGVLLLLQDDVHTPGSLPAHAHLQQPEGPPGRRRPDALPGERAKGFQHLHLRPGLIFKVEIPKYL